MYDISSPVLYSSKVHTTQLKAKGLKNINFVLKHAVNFSNSEKLGPIYRGEVSVEEFSLCPLPILISVKCFQKLNTNFEKKKKPAFF